MNPFRRPGPLALALVVASPLAAPAQVAFPPSPAAPLAPPRVVPGAALPVQGAVVQQGVPVATTTTVAPAAPTIGSHQIDRFEAIRQLQADLASDANNAANWTILGELAHEVALDLPQGQDDAYYTLSRQAYEKAAQLDPNNPGLKSAVQFAREQETNAAAFDAKRRQGVATYLESRRREMAANGNNPTVLVYETPAAPVNATATTVPAQPGVVNQPYNPAAGYPTPTYRPYYNPQAQQALGYNQYSNGYTPPANAAPVNGVQPAPTTLRQYGQQLPGVLLNEGARAIGRPR